MKTAFLASSAVLLLASCGEKDTKEPSALLDTMAVELAGANGGFGFEVVEAHDAWMEVERIKQDLERETAPGVIAIKSQELAEATAKREKKHEEYTVARAALKRRADDIDAMITKAEASASARGSARKWVRAARGKIAACDDWETMIGTAARHYLRVQWSDDDEARKQAFDAYHEIYRQGIHLISKGM